jgi:hypothetical protein
VPCLHIFGSLAGSKPALPAANCLSYSSVAEARTVTALTSGHDSHSEEDEGVKSSRAWDGSYRYEIGNSA